MKPTTRHIATVVLLLFLLLPLAPAASAGMIAWDVFWETAAVCADTREPEDGITCGTAVVDCIQRCPNVRTCKALSTGASARDLELPPPNTIRSDGSAELWLPFATWSYPGTGTPDQPKVGLFPVTIRPACLVDG